MQKTTFSFSPMKQLRPTSANPTVTPTSSNRGSSINIIPIENPEKRLSIRPLMTTAPPLPSCPEISGSDSSSEGPLNQIRTWDWMGNSILKSIHILFKKSWTWFWVQERDFLQHGKNLLDLTTTFSGWSAYVLRNFWGARNYSSRFSPRRCIYIQEHVAR